MQFVTLLAVVFCTVVFSSVEAHGDDKGANANTTGAYTLVDDLTYTKFFEAFDFFTGEDPTRGFVQYQSLESAISKGLVGYLDDTETVFMGVNYKDKQEKGRDSVRLESKKTWNQGLFIAEIHHMPINECGVWPAYWFLGSDDQGKYNWPQEGEIDVLEGVNDYATNTVTLHTVAGCTIDDTTQLAAGSNDAPTFTGNLSTSNCDVKAEGQPKNMGCSIKALPAVSEAQMAAGDSSEQVELPSYGEAFNKVGGGIYATEWTSTSISVWFIPRNSPIYNEYFAGNATSSPDPSKWGTPLAHFSGSGCDYVERFKNLKMIWNVSFCGEWAGEDKEWSRSCAAKTGAATCHEYVRDNPEKFEEAYWEVAGVKWYQRNQASSKRGVEPPAYVKREKGRHRRV